jgi:hypothetical protein
LACETKACVAQVSWAVLAVDGAKLCAPQVTEFVVSMFVIRCCRML